MCRITMIFGLFLAVFCVSGCGAQLAKVTGKVNYKGIPLKQGNITFLPENGRAASGKIVDGEIVEVTTLEANDGVAVGPCKITITALENPNDMYKAKPLIPTQYGNAKQSDLRAEIKPGTNELKLDLKDLPK